MSDNQLARRRVTYNQLQNLWEFLNTHRQIGSGYNKSAQAREYAKQMWGRAASILNSAGEGAVKSGHEWSKYWVDFKAKIKRKNRMIRDARSRTGGGPSTEQELSEIELKFLRILGEDYGSGLPGVQVDPFSREQESASTSTPEVPSQPTASNQSEEAIYLDVDVSEEYQFDQELSTSSAQIPSPEQPSANPIRIMLSPLQPSGSFIPLALTPREVNQEQEPLNLSAQVPPPQQCSANPVRIRLSSLQPAEIPPPQQPSSNPIRIRVSPLQPSVSLTPPTPTQRENRNPLPERTRRQRLQRPLTATAARARLVATSEARARAELANSRSIEQGVRILGDIAFILRRIETRLSGEVPRGD